MTFPYLLFFQHDAATLRVYALVHTKRDLPEILLERWPDEPSEG